MFMIVSIELTEQQKKLAGSYAAQCGMTLEEAAKEALLEAVEEWQEVQQALKEYGENPVSYSMEEAEKILGL